jgi:hypothetical protein
MRSLHVMALVQLVIAWPVYELLSRNPEFFLARQAQPDDIVFLVFSLSAALPLLLAGLQALVFRINSRIGGTLYALIIFLLFFLLGHLIANRFNASAYVTTWATIVSLALLFIYLRMQPGKMFISFLTPAILVVPVLFLLNTGIRPLLLPMQAVSNQSTVTAGELSPLLFVVFDEFPSNVLLGPDGLIDARRFPNLSAISKEAYWFPNATTVATSTVLAIPAILTGRYPDTYRMPHYGEYPDNLFTWLGDDYDINAHEAVSAMCPASLCSAGRLPPASRRWQSMMQDVSAVYLSMTAKQLLPNLPAINQSWEGFWGGAIQGGGMYEHRMQQLDAFLDKLQFTQKPGLDFLHVNFPHIPYEYLPSGKRYNDGWLMPGLDFTTNIWTGEDWQSRQAYERLVMQVGALDNWLGRLVEKLKAEGLYERSLIVLTADHGVSIEPGSGRRDAPTENSLDASILPVPLIIKAPFQSQGHKDTRNAEVIDILPTVAQMLERDLPWETDGVSLLGEPRQPGKRAVRENDKVTLYSSSLGQVEKALDSAWVRQQWNPPGDALTGDPLTNFVPGYDSELRITLNNAEYFQNVDPLGDFMPAHANGDIRWPGHAAADLAIVLNGTIVAVTTAYTDKGTWKFSAMLPESVFRAGNNVVEVLGLVGNEEGLDLVRGVASDDRTFYTWDSEVSAMQDSQGTLIPDNEGIVGLVDYFSRGEDSLEVFGWGIDTAQSRALETVLIFEGEELIWQGKTHMLREETHSFGVVIEIGFNAVIPLGILKDRNGSGLRIFAVSDNRRVRELLLKYE